MWTPKRIVLLALGFFVFFAGYLLYASCLGGIDGLPPLPDIDMPNPAGPDALGPMPPRGLKLEDKLRQAFGPQCPELNWALKLEMNTRNMVVAAKNFKIDDDGRLDLDHISVALFGKDPRDGREVEINTIRAKKAYLQFDKKLGRSEKDFGARRIVAAELSDEIEIVNNHRTAQRDDDLHLNIEKGPLYFDDAKHLIWTTDKVHVEDDRNQPPMDVRGEGMDVHLTPAEPPQPRPDAPLRGKAKSERFSGVDSIVLHSNVVMHMYSTGGFISHASEANAKPPAPAKGPAAPPAKSDVSIFTPGQFRYDFHKEGDLARFDVLEADPAHPQKSAPVKVIRHSVAADGKDVYDQLICQHLELKLTRKDGAAGHDDNAADHGLQIETAHAVALGGEEVEVKSDAEKLLARGHDFLYNSRTHLTILKGDPNNPVSGMSADSDGNLIHAREMQIQEQQGPTGKSWRQIIAKGPGRLDFQEKEPVPSKKPDPNKKPQPPKKPTHAFWNDKLTSTKDGALDLITLTGAAKFIDDENEQTLQAETLKVWLTSPEGGPPASQPAPQRDARRPSHVEATGNVSAKSKEMTIPHAGQLVVWFRDVPAGTMLPATSAAAPGQASAGPAKTAAPAGAAAPTKTAPKTAGSTVAGAAPANAEPEPVRPIDLTARSVYVWVARSEDKTALEKLDAEGDVAVRQDPAKPGEKPLDVKGASLELTYHPEGDFLVVRGDLAQLQMDTIYILGPEVTIDQASNKAWVVGAGAMQLESQTNFQGDKLAKPVPMTIYWNDNMFFNGRYAEFSKGVQAKQDDALLVCQSLQVFFDRPISLKEGNRGGPAPRVKNLVCYKDVRVDDRTLEGDRVVSAKRLTGPALNMNALESEETDPKVQSGSTGNEIRMPGPGDVRLFQIGGTDPLAAPADPKAKTTAAKPAPGATPAAAKKPDDQMKLTYISYGGATGGSMYANSKTNTATFLENVRVLNMPCDNPNIEIHLDEMLDSLPEGALYLRADRLDLYNRGDKTKSQQEMTAKGHVLVQAKDFYARSDVMRYSEAKDQIIFEGGDGGYATLYKIKQRGAAPQKLEGHKITYIRSTGRYQVDGGDWISGEN